MINDGRDLNTEIRYGLTSDTILYGILPAGYILESILVENITANLAQLSLGGVASTGDYFASQAINPSGQTLIPINKIPISKEDTTLYLNSVGNGDTWNSATLNFKFTFRRAI